MFFTDGITEAMHRDADLFGEARLSQIVEEYGHLPSDDLQARIVNDIHAFVGCTEQHDDMTTILVKTGNDVAAAPPAHVPTEVAE